MGQCGQLHIDGVGTLELTLSPRLSFEECEFDIPKRFGRNIEYLFGKEISVYYWRDNLQLHFKGRIVQITRSFNTGDLTVRVAWAKNRALQDTLELVTAELTRQKLTR